MEDSGVVDRSDENLNSTSQLNGTYTKNRSPDRLDDSNRPKRAVLGDLFTNQTSFVVPPRSENTTKNVDVSSNEMSADAEVLCFFAKMKLEYPVMDLTTLQAEVLKVCKQKEAQIEKAAIQKKTKKNLFNDMINILQVPLINEIVEKWATKEFHTCPDICQLREELTQLDDGITKILDETQSLHNMYINTQAICRQQKRERETMLAIMEKEKGEMMELRKRFIRLRKDVEEKVQTAASEKKELMDNHNNDMLTMKNKISQQECTKKNIQQELDQAKETAVKYKTLLKELIKELDRQKALEESAEASMLLPDDDQSSDV